MTTNQPFHGYSLSGNLRKKSTFCDSTTSNLEPLVSPRNEKSGGVARGWLLFVGYNSMDRTTTYLTRTSIFCLI